MAEQLLLDLEGMEVAEKPIRLLYKPSPTELETTKNMLRRDTKGTLQERAEPFFTLMKKYRFRYDCGNGFSIMPKQIAAFMTSKTQPKETWVEMLAIFYNEHNFPIIFEGMSDKEVELWHEVIRNRFLIDRDVNKIMGKDCFNEAHRYGAILKEPLSHYFYAVYKKSGTGQSRWSYEQSYFIFVGSSLQQMLLKKFFPDLVNIRGLNTLPKDQSLKTYNGENLVFSKLPVLASLYNSGLFPSGFAKLTGATIKKIQKALSLPDFFSTYPDSKQPPLSTALMANFYLFFRAYQGRKALPLSPETLVKEIIDKTYTFNAFVLSVCLPYIKGIKTSHLSSSSFKSVMRVMLSLIKTHYDKGWLPLDSLIMKARTFDASADTNFLLFDTYDIDSMDLRNAYASNDTSIHLGYIIKHISEPFVKSLLFMLATFGIVEIAYREPTENDVSYYDGLRYVRLTELGKYVLEITHSYTPQTTDGQPAFELDSQRLFIKVLRADSPFVPLLTDYAERITPSLYRVSYDNFLRRCTDANSVRQKISLFSQYICAQQPPIWQRFFKEIETRIHPLHPLGEAYTLMRLSPGDHELQQLILTEPSIRKYVLKVENYMILVRNDDMKPFTEALRKYGYLQ